MKLLIAGIALFLIVETNARWINFPIEAIQGGHDMWRAYSDMREANTIGADKYFHARGNADAASRGEGGKWAAEVISNGREWVQEKMGHGAEDSAADQRANEHGRNGGDPNVFRPAGLPPCSSESHED
ncbi:serum amyloid A [Gymnodraco acuticeps]|uniref:Serum amyloid A protein n=1 Tax=Gymnodraco acuticeps TaxID=8218 RepID=A0A6P8VBL3_GYMAC|nr:serum amyloid A [Gymnodraco acuticeps]XP_034074431.1 serum amyloid A [Gymnodraco acuticeps]